MQGYGAGAVIILLAARCFFTRPYEFLMFFREIEGSHCGKILVHLLSDRHSPDQGPGLVSSSLPLVGGSVATFWSWARFFIARHLGLEICRIFIIPIGRV